MKATTITTEEMSTSLSRADRRWLDVWCVVVVIFGVVLTGAAFAATDAPVRALLTAIGGIDLPTLDRPLRFAVALMGAVTLGWGLTLGVVVGAIERLAGDDRRRTWRGIAAAVLAWFVVDSILSVATGFAFNAVSNTVLVVGFLVPLVRGRAIMFGRAG